MMRLPRLTALANYREPEVWLSRASILAAEYHTKYGKKVELAAIQKRKQKSR